MLWSISVCWSKRLLFTGLFIIGLLSGTELTAAQVYKVGVFDNKPIVFESEPGKYAGLSIDVLESIAADENLQFEYIYAPWKTLLAKLKAGELDLLVGIAFSEERAKLFDYTNETLINNWGVVYHGQDSAVTSLQDLRGKNVALMNGSIHSRVFTNIMKNFSFEFKPVLVASYLEALQSVEQGKADAAVINRVISLLNASRYEVIETGIIFNPVEVRMASPKGKNAELLSKIDYHLAAQKQDKGSPYHLSLNRWISSTNPKIIPVWLKYAIGMFVITVLVLIFSNILIRRQVAARTAELSESELRFRQLAETINEVFWIGSPDWGQVHYVSPQFEKVWGLKRQQLYDDPNIWLEAVHPEDRDKVIADIAKKSAGNLGNPDIPSYRVVSSDGELRWILARAYPIRNDKGEVTRIAGIAEDITARKEYEDKISFMAMHSPSWIIAMPLKNTCLS